MHVQRVTVKETRHPQYLAANYWPHPPANFQAQRTSLPELQHNAQQQSMHPTGHPLPPPGRYHPSATPSQRSMPIIEEPPDELEDFPPHNPGSTAAQAQTRSDAPKIEEIDDHSPRPQPLPPPPPKTPVIVPQPPPKTPATVPQPPPETPATVPQPPPETPATVPHPPPETPVTVPQPNKPNKPMSLDETLVSRHPEATPAQVKYFAKYATEKIESTGGNPSTKIWEPEEVDQLYQEWKAKKKSWIFHLYHSWDKLLEKIKQIFKRTPQSDSSTAKTA